MSNKKSILVGTVIGFVGGMIAGKYGKQICSYVKNGVDRKPIEDMALEIKENMKKNKDEFCKTLETFSDNIFMKNGQKNENIEDIHNFQYVKVIVPNTEDEVSNKECKDNKTTEDINDNIGNIHNFQYVKVTVPNKEDKVSNKECVDNKITEDTNQIITDILKEVDKKDKEKSVLVEKDEFILPKVSKEVEIEEKQLVDKEDLILPKVSKELKDKLPLPKVPKELKEERKYNNTSSLKRRQNQKGKSQEVKKENSSEEK